MVFTTEQNIICANLIDDKKGHMSEWEVKHVPVDFVMGLYYIVVFY